MGSLTPEGDTLKINVKIDSSLLKPYVGMNESYTFRLSKLEGLVADIESSTYFGARHALETLFQLAEWDSYNSRFVILDDVWVADEPHYMHRGFSLDTSRNFYSVEEIKQLIDSLSYSKMNVFHWHITDSQSFPLELESLPDFTWFGAYRQDMIYTKADVKEVVDYATARGIMVIPELDAPAHVGNGWQAVDQSFVVCLEKEPWEEFCVEPPCGQLNPAAPGMYDVLETIHMEFLSMFSPSILHMGGDEVQ